MNEPIVSQIWPDFKPLVCLNCAPRIQHHVHSLPSLLSKNVQSASSLLLVAMPFATSSKNASSSNALCS